jgi:hypothetical protein
MEIPMRRTALLLIIGLMLPAGAQAQQSGPVANEPNAESAGQFRNITSTGVTKPPGGGDGVSENRPSEAVRKQRSIDRKIETGICIGCN